MLAETHSRTVPKGMQVFIHTLDSVFIAIEPALRSKVICVFAKDVLVAMQHRLVHLYFVATWKEPTAYLGASRRHISRQTSANNSVTSHALFDAGSEVGHPSGVLVLDAAVSMHHRVDFSLELCIYFRMLDDMGHDLAYVSGRALRVVVAHHPQCTSAGVRPSPDKSIQHYSNIAVIEI